MKRKAPASAANDVAKKLKGAHTPPDDHNGQQVRQFSVFISWYLYKFHYPMFLLLQLQGVLLIALSSVSRNSEAQ